MCKKKRCSTRCNRCRKQAKHEILIEETDINMQLCPFHMKYFRYSLESAQKEVHHQYIS